MRRFLLRLLHRAIDIPVAAWILTTVLVAVCAIVVALTASAMASIIFPRRHSRTRIHGRSS